MLNVKLNKALINKIYTDYNLNELNIAVKSPLKIVKNLGQKNIENGVAFNYLAIDDIGLHYFTIIYNKQNKAFEYIWGAYIDDLFPNLRDYLLESFIENINMDIINFMEQHSEY